MESPKISNVKLYAGRLPIEPALDGGTSFQQAVEAAFPYKRSTSFWYPYLKG